jgi:hypothetical protein
MISGPLILSGHRNGPPKPPKQKRLSSSSSALFSDTSCPHCTRFFLPFSPSSTGSDLHQSDAPSSENGLFTPNQVQLGLLLRRFSADLGVIIVALDSGKRQVEAWPVHDLKTGQNRQAVGSDKWRPTVARAQVKSRESLPPLAHQSPRRCFHTPLRPAGSSISSDMQSALVPVVLSV